MPQQNKEDEVTIIATTTKEIELNPEVQPVPEPVPLSKCEDDSNEGDIDDKFVDQNHQDIFQSN